MKGWMNVIKRKIILCIVFILALSLMTGCSQGSIDTNSPNEVQSAADDYPNKPISMVLSASAGGSTDVMGRILAKKLEEQLGQPVVVVNKPGAGSWICWEYIVEEAKPDGYTFTNIATPYNNLGAFDPVNPRKYTIDDFDYLANQVTDYNVIGIRNDEDRFNDLASLIEYAKNETLIVAGSAVGILSDDATVVEYFNKNFETKFDMIQTDGAKDTETMFLSKTSDILVANIADVFTAYRSKNYKIIALFAPERSGLMPDVPTASEEGFEDFYMYSARGWGFPKGVDPSIREKFMDALKNAINDPEMKGKLLEQGAETHYIEGQQYYDFLKSNIDISKQIYDIE